MKFPNHNRIQLPGAISAEILRLKDEHLSEAMMQDASGPESVYMREERIFGQPVKSIRLHLLPDDQQQRSTVTDIYLSEPLESEVGGPLWIRLSASGRRSEVVEIHTDAEGVFQEPYTTHSGTLTMIKQYLEDAYLVPFDNGHDSNGHDASAAA